MSKLSLFKHHKRATRNIDSVVPKKTTTRKAVNQIQLEKIPTDTCAKTIYVVRNITPQHVKFRTTVFLYYRWRLPRNPSKIQLMTSTALAFQAYRCTPTQPNPDHQSLVSDHPTA